jgi:hypothetical protein
MSETASRTGAFDVSLSRRLVTQSLIRLVSTKYSLRNWYLDNLATFQRQPMVAQSPQMLALFGTTHPF